MHIIRKKLKTKIERKFHKFENGLEFFNHHQIRRPKHRENVKTMTKTNIKQTTITTKVA